jgi:hypothetical protein
MQLCKVMQHCRIRWESSEGGNIQTEKQNKRVVASWHCRPPSSEDTPQFCASFLECTSAFRSHHHCTAQVRQLSLWSKLIDSTLYRYGCICVCWLDMPMFRQLIWIGGVTILMCRLKGTYTFLFWISILTTTPAWFSSATIRRHHACY